MGCSVYSVVISVITVHYMKDFKRDLISKNRKDRKEKLKIE